MMTEKTNVSLSSQKIYVLHKKQWIELEWRGVGDYQSFPIKKTLTVTSVSRAQFERTISAVNPIKNDCHNFLDLTSVESLIHIDRPKHLYRNVL